MKLTSFWLLLNPTWVAEEVNNLTTALGRAATARIKPGETRVLASLDADGRSGTTITVSKISRDAATRWAEGGVPGVELPAEALRSGSSIKRKDAQGLLQSILQKADQERIAHAAESAMTCAHAKHREVCA